MNLEDELRRHLRLEASGVRSEPDAADLARRIRAREQRAARGERLALTGAAIVLAGSLGGLAGALMSSPGAIRHSTKFTVGADSLSPKSPAHTSRHGGSSRPAGGGPRTVVSERLASGVSIRATTQALSAPVEIDSAWSSFSSCSRGEVVTTTIASGSAIGGGTGVSGLVPLGSGGLEVVASGAIPASSASEVWWVTVAVGDSVAKVAAEDPAGAIVTARPTRGLAVLAAETSSAVGWVSAVAETASGQSISPLQVLLGSGPKVVNAPSGPAAGGVPSGGCSAIRVPSSPSSASASQPAAPALAAASIVGSYERAFSPDLWQGFASNLVAVAGAARLGADAGAAATDGGLTLPHRTTASGRLPVEIRQVTFRSAVDAEVVYQLADGVWRVGAAQLGSGLWRVALTTYCAAVRAGAGVIAPTSIARACALPTTSHGASPGSQQPRRPATSDHRKGRTG